MEDGNPVVYANGTLKRVTSPTFPYQYAPSCLSSTYCAIGASDGTALVFNGTSVGATASTVDNSTKPQPSVLAASCVAPTFCAAVGWFGAAVGS